MFTEQRECGFRNDDSLYSVLGVGPGGKPLDEFLIDHPRKLPEGFHLAPQGVQLFEIDGVNHIFDWVGESNYASVPHFWTEAHHWLVHSGTAISRKLPKTLDFSKLDYRSKHYLVHPKARLLNGHELCVGANGSDPSSSDLLHSWQCPKRFTKHQPLEWYIAYTCYQQGYEKPDPCIGMCWRALPEESPLEAEAEERRVQRSLACGATLNGYLFPKGVSPIFEPGIFARYPLSVHVIAGEMTEQLVEAVSKAAGVKYEVRDV